VSTRRHASDFYPHRDRTPICAGRIHMHTHIEPISFGRSIAIAPIPRRSRACVSRRLGRFFAGTVAHGGAREDDGRRRRETGDARRETRDARRETRDGRRETRAETTSVSTSRRGRPWDEARGRRRCVRFFHARVGAREGLVRRSSLVVGDDSHGFEESRRISTSPTRGGA
jgi:hypothetical protein